MGVGRGVQDCEGRKGGEGVNTSTETLALEVRPCQYGHAFVYADYRTGRPPPEGLPCECGYLEAHYDDDGQWSPRPRELQAAGKGV